MRTARRIPRTCWLLCLLYSPFAVADEASLSNGVGSSSISWYLYGGMSGDYDGLARDWFPGSKISDIALEPVSTDIETTTQLGFGGVYCLNDRFALDFGLSYGSAQMKSTLATEVPIFDSGTVGSDSLLLELESDVEVFEGNLIGRFYPRTSCRLRPWLAAGVRGILLRPQDLRDEELSSLLGKPENVSAVEGLAGLGLDIQLTDRFDLGLSAEHGFDTGQRFGIRLVLKVGTGGCGGRCRKRHDPTSAVGAVGDGDPAIVLVPSDPPGQTSEPSSEQDPACGRFLPGEATLPHIMTPSATVRRPLRLDPGALPAGARAFFPAFDGDRFFVHFPSLGADRPPSAQDAASLFDRLIVPTLRAVGFEPGASALRMPPAGGIEVPGADLAALAEAVAIEVGSVEPKPTAERVALLETLLGERPPDAATDLALQGSLGMTFAELEAEVTRSETLYPFQQMHDEVPIEHTLLLASLRPDDGAMSLRGTLIGDYRIANSDILGSPVVAARRSMRAIPGVLDIELPAAGDGPTLVLLPYGSDADGRIQLRYSYRMILTAHFCGQGLPFLLWLDAQDGTLLKLEPLVSEATAGDPPTLEAAPVAARARVFNRDPGVGPAVTYLHVDPAQDGHYALKDARGLNRVDFGGNGFDELDLAIPDDAEDSSHELANFDQSPINDAKQALCGAGSNKQFQQVHFFSSLARYRRYALALGFEPFFSLAWQPRVEDKYLGCGAESSMRFGACNGYTDPACPDYWDGTLSQDNCMNFAHDNTVIAHEVGHNMTLKLTNWRPFDWCEAEKCALPIGWGPLHDLADFWSALLESTHCVGGWVCKNIGGVDASLGCRRHSESFSLPRLLELPVPFEPNAPGDHFPEHRRLASDEYADMQIAAAALWELQLGMRSKNSSAGLPLFAPRFARALRKGGFNRATPASTDLGIYQYLFQLENELVDEWRAAAGHLTSKVTAAFARAGIFLVPYQCLGSGPTPLDPDSCPPGIVGDAVIDVDDNDPEDDYTIRDVRHREVDYLELGGPAPTFQIWTGPRYRFDATGTAVLSDSVLSDSVLSDSAPCYREHRVEVSTDPEFSTGATFDSGWRSVPGAACYATWAPDPAMWATLQAAGMGARIYYRVTTRHARDGPERISTAPGNGLWTVPPPYVVLTADGTSRF